MRTDKPGRVICAVSAVDFYADFSCAGDFVHKISKTNNPAPVTMALSDTSNDSHGYWPTEKIRKSMTRPQTGRSHRVPIPPPIISASPTPVVLMGVLFRHNKA